MAWMSISMSEKSVHLIQHKNRKAAYTGDGITKSIRLILRHKSCTKINKESTIQKKRKSCHESGTRTYKELK